VPAAAVIPAPIAYAKIAAVEKLVVGLRGEKEALGACRPNSRACLRFSNGTSGGEANAAGQLGVLLSLESVRRVRRCVLCRWSLRLFFRSWRGVGVTRHWSRAEADRLVARVGSSLSRRFSARTRVRSRADSEIGRRGIVETCSTHGRVPLSRGGMPCGEARFLPAGFLSRAPVRSP